MMEQASPVCSPVSSVPREHVKTFTVSTKLYDGAEDDASVTDVDDEGHHTHHHRQQHHQQRQQSNNNTYIITTKTFDGCVAPSSSSPTKKKCFSRKNSTDSSPAADNVGGQQQQQKKKKSKKNWRDTRRISTDSTAGLGLYNDDELWTQRIGEIMNRGFGGGVEVPLSSVSRDPPPTPIDGVKESVRMAPPPPSSSSRSRCRSTDYLSSQSKNKSGGGGPPSFSRRGSMEMEGGRDINNNKFARKNSRSTSPKFIPPIDTFGGEAPPDATTTTTASSKPKRGFTRRNSMTRSRSPKFVEPLTTTDHDSSRVFQGRLRRHSSEGPNPFTTRQLETLRESVREKRAEELSSSGCEDYEDESSVDDNIAEMVRHRLEGIEEPSTPTPPKGDNDDDDDDKVAVVPRKPFSRHNSIEGVVDTSIFPSLPSLEQGGGGSNETDPNFDLAMLFQHLVEDNIDDDDDEDDDEDLIVGEDSDDDDEDDGDDNIIKRHSKIRRRCSTGGLRTFERENLRNFLEDNEGDDDDAEAAEAASRRRSFFKRCSTGGLRTLQRENSRDMYSDDSSLDGIRGRVPLADDNSSFEKYLRKMTQEAVVDTSNDVHIIEDHVNRGMAWNLSREDSDDDDGNDNIIKRHSKIRRRCSTGGLRTFEREDLRNFLEDNEGDDDDNAEAAAEAASRRRSFFKRCSTGGLRTLQRENSRDMYSDDSSLDGREGRLHLADDKSFEKYLQRMTQEAVVDTSEDVHIIEDHVGRGMPRRSSIRSVSSAAEEENSNDFAAFISRVGMGAADISSSQTVATVSTAANTSYAEDSHVSRNEVETVRSSAVKKTYPHSIHMPHSNGSSHNESVSSLENSNRQGSGPVVKVVPTKKTSSEVHFKSSKSRSIRRLASKDGIDELKKFADGLDAPALTRRASGSAIMEPDLGDVVLKDLPDLIKGIDRDLVTERAVYRKRQSGDASTGEASILSEERKKESGDTVQFNVTQARKNLEPAGTSACVPDEDGLQETRKQDLHFMEDSFLTTDAQSNYIRKGSVDQQRGEIPPVPVIALGEIPDGAAYQPKRRRSSTRTEDRQRSGKKSKSRERSSSKQGKPLDEKRRKEMAKNSPFRNNKDGSSLREGSIAALKGLRRKLSSGKGI